MNNHYPKYLKSKLGEEMMHQPVMLFLIYREADFTQLFLLILYLYEKTFRNEKSEMGETGSLGTKICCL